MKIYSSLLALKCNNSYKGWDRDIIMKKSIILCLLLGFLVSLTLVSALTASIGNPRMVLYKNLTGSETLEFENKVTVINDNDFKVNITIIPTEIWEDKIRVIGEDKFVLEGGERTQVNYTITLDEPGYYGGDILINFYDPGTTNTLSLAQDLVVIVSDSRGEVPGSDTGGNLWTIAIILLVAIIVITLLITRFRKK